VKFDAWIGRWTSLRKSRGWAGVFFSPAELQAVMVAPAGESRAVSAPLPVEAAVQSLRQQMAPDQFQIVTAVGAEDVLCQIQRLPTANDAELRQMVELQIDNLLPVPAEEAVYSFESLGTADNQTWVVVAIARKDAVNQRVAALEAAGLPPAIVTVDALAVFRALLRREALPVDDRHNSALIVTPTAVHLVVYARTTPLAIRSLVLPVDGDWRAELQRTLLSLAAGGAAGAPGRVTVVNLTAATQPVAATVAAELGGTLLADGAVPTPAASLCQECAEGGGLNLLPDEWRQRRRQARLRRDLWRGGIAAAAAAAAVTAALGLSLLWRQWQLRDVQAAVARLQPEYRRARDMHSEMVAMQRQLDTKYSALEVLREVSLRLPDAVKLTGFVFKKDQKVTLRGQAQTAGAALEYVGQLDKCELFGEVKTVSMSTPPGGGLTKFEVDCRLKTAAAVAPVVTPGNRKWR